MKRDDLLDRLSESKCDLCFEAMAEIVALRLRNAMLVGRASDHPGPGQALDQNEPQRPGQSDPVTPDQS